MVIVVSCSCLGVPCLARKLDSCVLLFVVELVAVVDVDLLLCAS